MRVSLFVHYFCTKTDTMHLSLVILQHLAIGFFLSIIFCLSTRAQEICVIIDKETGTPIRDVNIFTDKGGKMVTDYQGRVSVADTFKTATVTHASYLTREVNREELKDTLWLLPLGNRLGEVVVWGMHRPKISSMVMGITADAANYAPPKSGVSFDFFNMFRKKPLSKKARKKNKQLLRDWDKLYVSPAEKESDKKTDMK